MRDPMDDSLTEPSLPTCFVCHQPEDGHVHKGGTFQTEHKRLVDREESQVSMVPIIMAAIL